MPQTLKEAYTTPEALEKFKANFEAKWRANKEGCWIWTARRDSDDYGQVSVGTGAGRVQRAHRVAYELYTGEAVPEGMDIDHLCHIRRCVNPEHLEIVTHNENMQRLRGDPEDWDEEKFEESKTQPEEILEQALRVIEQSNVSRPIRGGADGGGYGLATLDGAPWRDMRPINGYTAQDKFSLVYLFLECVRFGVAVREATEKVLGVSQFSLQEWSRNGYFREDLEEAKRDGRRYRYEVLEGLHLDQMERKIAHADFKDVANSLAKLRDTDPATRKATAEAAAAAGAPNIAIIVNGPKSVEVLQQAVRIGEEIIDAEEVTVLE